MAFLVGPILFLVLFSFTGGELAAFPIERFSLRWWSAMAGNAGFRAALRNSLIIGVSAASISAVLGTLAALGLAQIPPRRAQAAMAVLPLPLMLPPLVLGIALLSFDVWLGVPLGFGTAIASHLLFTLPFVILVIYARLRSFDFAMIERARDPGASLFGAFWTVTFPIVRPSIIGGALLSLALSIDDFVITFFSIGTGNTLPTFVWGMIRTSLTPTSTANAIGTLIVLLTMATTMLALRLTRFGG